MRTPFRRETGAWLVLILLASCGDAAAPQGGPSSPDGGPASSGADTDGGAPGMAGDDGGGGPFDAGGASFDGAAFDAGGPVASCGTYTPGDDLAVCAATYVGGTGDNHLTAVAIARDGSVVASGSVAGTTMGVTPTVLLGGTTGAIVRLDPKGQAVRSLTLIGSAVADLAMHPDGGTMALVGDFGVALLDDAATTVMWSHALAGASHVDIGSDGTVAVLAGNAVTTFSSAGSMIGSFSVSATAVNDVAVDGAGQSVFVTGYRQDDGGSCSQYKSTFVRAITYSGMPKWTDYDWKHGDVGASSDCADTTGLALGMGRDGKLYFGAKADGGNTVLRKDPRDLSKSAPNVASDAYNTAYGLSGANAIGYYARLDPATGAIEKGQFLLARNGTKGNAAVPAAITADEKGNVFVAGTAAYEIENHDKKQIGGVQVGPYAAYEAFALVVSPDFSQRLTWTVFTKSGPAEPAGIAAAHGIVAFGADQTAADVAKGALITVQAIESSPPGSSSAGYLAVWPAP